MNTPSPFRSIGFARDRRGSVALELALIMPLMLLMVLGFWEAYNYIRTVAMVERATASVANMMSRRNTALIDCRDSTSADDLGTYVEAAVRMMAPLSLENHGEVFLSAVGQNAGGAPTVLWQRRSVFELDDVSSILGVQGANAKLPAELAAEVVADGTINVLVAEVNYRFTPFAMTANFWAAAKGSVTISRVAYFRARSFNQTAPTAPVNPPCTGGRLPTPTPPA